MAKRWVRAGVKDVLQVDLDGRPCGELREIRPLDRRFGSSRREARGGAGLEIAAAVSCRGDGEANLVVIPRGQEPSDRCTGASGGAAVRAQLSITSTASPGAAPSVICSSAP